MAMQVKHKADQCALVFQIRDERPDESDFGYQKCEVTLGIPFSVEVLATEVGAVVPEDHSVWVYHRYYIHCIVV